MAWRGLQSFFISILSKRHVAISAAEFCHRHSAKLRFATIDDTLIAEQAYAERVIWRKWAREIDLPLRTEEALIAVHAEGDGLIDTLRSELTNEETEIRTAQVIFDYGTRPADELYHALRARSCNQGVTHLESWVAGEPQSPMRCGSVSPVEGKSNDKISTRIKSAHPGPKRVHDRAPSARRISAS